MFCNTLFASAQDKTATIKVKKSNTFSKVLLDSTFTHLIVLNAYNEKVDSCITSFDMIVKARYGGGFGMPNGDTIPLMLAVSNRSHCSYLTPDMKKMWNAIPLGKLVYFQNIYVRGTNNKQYRLNDFAVNKQ